MRELIRWYKESPPRLRVVFRAGAAAGRTDHAAAGRSHAVRPGPSRASRPGRRRILFVCHGNLCRSPVAAGLLQARLDADAWEIVSAGTHARDGMPAAAKMLTAAAEAGIDLSAHSSTAVSPRDLRDADLIIAMSRRQATELLRLDPACRRRIRLLGGFDPQPNAWSLPADPRSPSADDNEIPDPDGEDIAFYRECCQRLDRAVERLSRWIERREASRLREHPQRGAVPPATVRAALIEPLPPVRAPLPPALRGAHLR